MNKAEYLKHYAIAHREELREYRKKWNRHKRHPEKYKKPRMKLSFKTLNLDVSPTVIDPRAKDYCVVCYDKIKKSDYLLKGNFCISCNAKTKKQHHA